MGLITVSVPSHAYSPPYFEIMTSLVFLGTSSDKITSPTPTPCPTRSFSLMSWGQLGLVLSHQKSTSSTRSSPGSLN